MEETKKKLLVLIIARGRVDYTRRTIDSLLKSCPGGTHFSIWHNGPMDFEMKKYFDVLFERKDFNIYLSPVDIGWGAGRNKHIREMDILEDGLDKYEYVLCTDNDVIYEEGWFEKLYALIAKYPQIGVLAVWKHIYHGTLGQQYPDLVVKDQMPGCGWFFKTERLKELLPFPENGTYVGKGGCGEDVTFCNIARDQKGYLIAGPVEDVAIHIDGY